MENDFENERECALDELGFGSPKLSFEQWKRNPLESLQKMKFVRIDFVGRYASYDRCRTSDTII